MRDYFKRRQEQIEDFCKEHNLQYEEVEGFIGWFEWQAKIEQRDSFTKMIHKVFHK